MNFASLPHKPFRAQSGHVTKAAKVGPDDESYPCEHHSNLGLSDHLRILQRT